MEEHEVQNARSSPAGALAVTFFVLVGAALAFVIGQHVGTSLDRHGRNVTIAATHVATPPPPPVAQK
jgi:hypothetical protein